MTTTLVLQPDDYANITFDVLRSDGPESGSIDNYEILLSSLNFHDEERLAFAYAQYQQREGGEVRDVSYLLTPIDFGGRVVGLGGSLETRIADLLSKSAALMRAITNSDGYFRYKPDGLAAGIMDTYYRYVRSVPPALIPGRNEWWGRTRASLDPVSYIDGIPTRQFTITLMTQPIAMSDPTNPIEVLAATTLNNIGDGTNDYLTIAAATVKGSMPALCRFIAHPIGTTQLANLWLAKRTAGLGSFVATYLTGAAQAPAGVWSTVIDAARCDGQYYRCTPVLNNTVYAMRYTIANWTSHEGRAAILTVIKSNGSTVTDFDIYYRWSIANFPLTGSRKQVSQVDVWEAILLGEIDLPETEMSAQEDLDLYLDICIERKSGTGTFDLDCIKLLFTDEAALQVEMPSGTFINSTYSFWLENFGEEISHAVVHANSKLAYICNAYGDFLTLEPDANNRIDVAWEGFIQDSYSDSFTGFGSSWTKIADMETDESWQSAVGLSLAAIFEGTQSLDPGLEMYLIGSWDFSGVAASSYLCIPVFNAPFSGTLHVFFSTHSDATWVDDYFRYTFAMSVGLNFLKMAKGSPTLTVGSPSWSNIVYIRVQSTDVTLVDDFRWSDADPDDLGTFNDTATIWDFPTGTWHIYELDGAEKSLGQIDCENGVEKVALVHTDFSGDIRYSARCRVKNGEGFAGVVFRCSDGTGGSEDCYALLLNTASDQLELRSYVAGASSNVSAPVAYTFNVDTDYYLGILAVGTAIQCFLHTDIDSLWDAGSKRFDVADSDHSSGQVGLMTIGSGTSGLFSLGRFTSISLSQIGDVQISSSQIQLSARALFRTIYPFYEAAS